VVSWAADVQTDIWTDLSISLDPATTQGQGYAAEATRSGKPAGTNRFCDDPRTQPWHGKARELGIASALALPLGTTPEGARRMLALYAREADYFNADEIRLLEQVAQDAALGLNLINTESRLAHSTTHDAVTGLPNAKLLMQRLRELLRQAGSVHQKVAVCVLDADMQSVTHELGLRQANTLLRAMGEQIEASCGVNDTVGVLPGERIALAISDVATMDKAESRLRQKLEQARTILSGSVVARARAGVAIFPEDGEDAEELIDRALSALDLADAEDGEPIHFFAPNLNRVLRENRALRDRLNGVIERGELSVDYQPIVSLRSGALSGFEALLRWNSPDLGDIPPERFIPLAESSGLINDIGEWLLQQVAQQASDWDGRATSGLFISVNVSAIQLRDVHFAERIGRVLDDCYNRTGRVRISMEVTESHLLKDIEKSIMLLRQLGGHGIEIILDDFGTGYSSLSYLHRLPLHVLKIDKSFTRDIVTNPLGRKMVAGIQALAHSLGLETVVEGIECIEQQKMVSAIGCTYAQGFLYDQGLSVEEVQRKWLPLPMQIIPTG
jgi:diguanylate cyclase (GGDEF)-like protein